MRKVRALNSQLDPMRQIISQLKKDKDSAKKKIGALEKEMQGVIEKLRVRPSTLVFLYPWG